MVDYWTRMQAAVLDALEHVKLDVGEVTIGNVKIIDQNSDDKVDVEKITGSLGDGTLNALMGKVKSFLSNVAGTVVDLPSTLTPGGGLKVGITDISRPSHSSTTDILLAAGIYPGVSVDALKYSRITGSLFSDQSGTLYIEQSPDNVNWDAVESIPYVGATKIGFDISLVAQYVQVRYVNGGVDQTAFRLYSWLKAVR